MRYLYKGHFIGIFFLNSLGVLKAGWVQDTFKKCISFYSRNASTHRWTGRDRRPTNIRRVPTTVRGYTTRIFSCC